MALIEWKDNYSVGIENLDNQHKGLVQQINILHDAMKIGKGKETLDKTLNTLIQYTSIHFQSEEKLFAQYSFPDAEKHIAEHKNFVEKVLSFKDDYDKGNVMITIDVMNFLRKWLINHILVSDMDYKAFLVSNGVK